MGYHKLVAAVIGVGLGFMTGPAQAETLQLKVYPANDAGGNCPAQVTAYQTPRPYQEGGYARDGMVVLDAIATNIELTQSTPFSALWVGTLKSQFQTCQGTAGIFRYDGQPYAGHSYIRLQLLQGKVFAILDMTGVYDANDYTAAILFKGMRDGNPRWTWGGTD